MISVVVCSRGQDCSEFSKNLAKTIGVAYELIIIDNSVTPRSIFEVYAEGVEKSKGDIICFVHDDVVFHSLDWGKSVVESFNDQYVGIVGIIGSYCFTSSMLYWTDSFTAGRLRSGSYSRLGHYNLNVYDDGMKYGNTVLAIDGLFMCIRKSLFDEHKIFWDKETFKGFHFYDMDICFQAHVAGYSTKLIDADFEHKSCGTLNRSFIENAQIFHNKWKDRLPLVAYDVNPQILDEQDHLDTYMIAEHRFRSSLLKKWPFTWIYKICRKFHFYEL